MRYLFTVVISLFFLPGISQVKANLYGTWMQVSSSPMCLSGSAEYLVINTAGDYVKFNITASMDTAATAGEWIFDPVTRALQYKTRQYYLKSKWREHVNLIEEPADTLKPDKKALVLLKPGNFRFTYAALDALPADLQVLYNTVQPLIAVSSRKTANNDATVCCCDTTLLQKPLQVKRGRRVREFKSLSDIELVMYSDNDSGVWSYHSMSGRYITTHADQVWLTCSEEEKEGVNENGVNFTEYATYSESTPPAVYCRQVDIAEVDYLRYSSPFRKKVNNISLGASVITGVAALVVAPLAGFNYGNGTFNGPRYMQWAGWSLAAFTASFTVHLATKPRRYYLVR